MPYSMYKEQAHACRRQMPNSHFVDSTLNMDLVYILPSLPASYWPLSLDWFVSMAVASLQTASMPAKLSWRG